MGMSMKTRLRHWLAPSRRSVLSDAALSRLGTRVSESEKNHSGEICIYVESRLPNSYLLQSGSLRAVVRQRALSLFGKLRVWDTEHNNGVLIYLLLAEHAIEIVADRGLNPWVPAATWQGINDRLAAQLRAHRFEDGLAGAIQEVDALLRQHFALAPGDDNPNELPNLPRTE